ncbi:hypothetical protein CAEBREN_04388 [Caenorhabditis brenneri]|uniref:Uncharacterized protein n=1 Tax=Caenorhabditis brenneri TaxID=135651 RepID=G0MWS2_CAEBE|nr:hypothetical protein CAEBREN_04388 [Caenorhabditis brenneri]
MQIFTGFLTIVYTAFVYFNVLSQPDQDWKWIIAIFCLTWTGIFLIKRAIDRYPYPNQFSRHMTMVTSGICIFSMVAHHIRSQIRESERQCDASTDISLFFAANVFLASYTLLIHKSSKKCQWDSKDRWIYEAIRYLNMVIFLSGLKNRIGFNGHVEMTDNMIRLTFSTDKDSMTDKASVFHEFILLIMLASNMSDTLAIAARTLKPKEDPVEDNNRPAPAPIELPMADEEVNVANNVARVVFNEERTVQE